MLEINVFRVVGRKGGFCQKLNFRKIGSVIVFDDLENKTGISSAHNCFGHFLDLGGSQKTKTTTKIGKIVNLGDFQNCTPPSKRGLLEWVSKGGVTICDTQKLCFVENTILKCFQQITAIAERKGVSCRGIEHLPNIVDCCSRCKEVI